MLCVKLMMLKFIILIGFLHILLLKIAKPINPLITSNLVFV